jgi:hypothetical protein
LWAVDWGERGRVRLKRRNDVIGSLPRLSERECVCVFVCEREARSNSKDKQR